MLTRARAIALLLAVALAACGCLNVHPRYPYEAVVWDEEILGVWQTTAPDGKTSTLRIEARPVHVDPVDHRINPDEGIAERRVAAAPDAATPPGEINQYLLTFTGSEGESWMLEAYLLKAGDLRLLAFQRTDPFIEENAGWVLPLHFIWRVQMDAPKGGARSDGAGGPTLRLVAPTDSVAWIPGIQWADAPDDGGTRPIPREVPARPGVRVAESLDRLLDYYRRHADDASFWEDDAMVLTRRP